MKILVFGNEFLKEDSIAKKISDNLGIEIKKIKDTFELVDLNLDEYIILDVVLGIEKVKEIKVEQLSEFKLLSAHDFDLGFFIKLKKAKPKIIGIPQKYDEEKAIEEVKELLGKL